MMFDVDSPYALAPQVALRPERFGALAYHFGTRRLSFLKRPELVTVVRGLEEHPTARAAVRAAGVAETEVPSYAAALARLAQTHMIERRAAA